MLGYEMPNKFYIYEIVALVRYKIYIEINYEELLYRNLKYNLLQGYDGSYITKII